MGVPLGHQRGMTQNRNFFFFSVSRLKVFIYRHFRDQKHDFEPIPYPASCKLYTILKISTLNLSIFQCLFRQSNFDRNLKY